MILFVGGSRHGTEYVRTVTVDKLDPAPPSFVDVQTAERYGLAPVSMTMLNPITNQAVAILENTVYVVEGLTDPQQLAMGLADSVTRWWFQTHGTHKEPAAAVAQQNGSLHPGEVLRAWCEGPGETCTPFPFATRMERAKWMEIHRNATGHTVRWSDAQATEGVTDGGQDQGNIH